MPEDKKSLTIGYYLVAFIDILGQKEHLRGLTDLPTTPEEKARFINVLKETYGTVEGFRTAFDTFFQAFNTPSRLPPMPEPMQQQFRDLRAVSIKTQRFSDTVILYAPLGNDTAKIPINGVYASLLACGTTFLAMLAGRNACRGGIDIGLAFEPHQGEIYGAALLSASQLERSVAQYHRIDVGHTLVEYLAQHAQASGQDPVIQYTRKFAKECLGLLTNDVNGQPFLDVLGEGYRQTVGGIESLRDIVRDAYAFVVEEAERAQQAGNSKLATRYGQLRQYFEARRPPPG